MLRLCLIALFLCLPLGARAAGSEYYAQLVHDAIEAQQLGNFVRARALFEAAHRLEPSARTLRGMGVVAFKAGDLPQAEIDLTAALEEKHKPLDEELRAAVESLLEIVQRGVGRYRLRVEPAEFVARVDEHAPLIDARGYLVLAPGWHTISVSALGHERREIEIEGRAGVLDELHVVLSPMPVSIAEILSAPAQVDRFQLRPGTKPPPELGPRVKPAANPPSADSPRDARVRAAMWVSLVTGSAFAVNAATLSVVGYTKKREIERDCRPSCSSSELDARVTGAHLDAYERAVNVSAALAAGGLASALGVWLFRHNRRGRVDAPPAPRLELAGTY